MRNFNEELKKRSIDYEKLVSYGFQKRKNQYYYETQIFEEQFLMIVIVSKDSMTSKLIDRMSDEEYSLVDIEDSVGEFVGKVREEYEEKLKDIMEQCTTPNTFKSHQSKEIVEYVQEKYGDKLEFLWEKFDDCAIVRNSKSKKWYGVFLTVSEKKLGGTSNEKIEILDVRYPKEKTQKIVDNKLFFPGYHMNKESWITVKLDGSVKTKKICELIDQSYDMTRISNAWVLPSNVKMFDVMGYFEKHHSIIWHGPKNVQVGDFVYIYLGVPYSAIMLKCKAVRVNLKEYTENDMEIELVEKYEKDKYPLSILKKYGLTAIRSPRSIPEKLAKYLEKNRT